MRVEAEAFEDSEQRLARENLERAPYVANADAERCPGDAVNSARTERARIAPARPIDASETIVDDSVGARRDERRERAADRVRIDAGIEIHERHELFTRLREAGAQRRAAAEHHVHLENRYVGTVERCRARGALGAREFAHRKHVSGVEGRCQLRQEPPVAVVARIKPRDDDVR